jgi:hypothetical protein
VSTLAGADARAKLMIAKGHERRDFTRQPSIETAGALRRRFAIESSDKPRPNEHSSHRPILRALDRLGRGLLGIWRVVGPRVILGVL